MEFIGVDEDEFKDVSRKPRKTGRTPINRQTKLNLVFDSNARRKFLTGFQKRKQERREKYHQKIEKDLVEEKLRSKEEAKKTVQKKQSSSHSILPEVQHLIEEDEDDDDDDYEDAEQMEFTIGSSTVSIASLDDTVCPRLLKVKEEDDEDEDEEGLLGGLLKEAKKKQRNIPSKEALKKSLLLKAAAAAASGSDPKEGTLVKKEANRILQSTDAYKKALRVKQGKSRKFKLHKFAPGARTEQKTKKTKKGKEKGGDRNKPSECSKKKAK